MFRAIAVEMYTTQIHRKQGERFGLKLRNTQTLLNSAHDMTIKLDPQGSGLARGPI